MNLIILTEDDKIKSNRYKILDNRFTHISKILKLGVNDFIEVGLLNGPTGRAKIVEMNSSEVLIEIFDLKNIPKNKHRIDIICALPRPQTLKKVLNTCATMGVNNLYLIRSEKVEKSYFHSPLLNETKYKKYLIEGLSQGKHTDIPIVSIHNRFKEFFNLPFGKIKNNSICLLANPDSDNYLNNISLELNNNIVLAIGPEGGWNEFETNLMEDKGFIKFKLSENILRVENAVTAAISQIELLSNKS